MILFIQFFKYFHQLLLQRQLNRQLNLVLFSMFLLAWICMCAFSKISLIMKLQWMWASYDADTVSCCK